MQARIAILLIILFSLTSCGQTGALYLPNASPKTLAPVQKVARQQTALPHDTLQQP